jgi:hypothetical protein
MFKKLLLITIFGLLAACASNPYPSAQSAVPMPGDADTYGFGVFQSKEDFANVEIAQLNFGMYKTQRSWQLILPNKGSARYLGLRAYYPVDVRWKLKDGREFILENIDTATIMREYFKTKNVLLQHQQERRSRDPVGDYDPELHFGIKDDTIVISWGLVMNRTPVHQRLPIVVNGKPARDGTPWKLEREEHFVTVLKGNPTSGIDFTKTWDFFK